MQPQPDCVEVKDEEVDSSANSQVLDTFRASDCSSTDKEGEILLCRVCHCAESDRRGITALAFLKILPPSQENLETDGHGDSKNKVSSMVAENSTNIKSSGREPKYIEFISPEGEVFVCSNDLESGPFQQQDILIDLGCLCKNELALAHYACALKWFVSHGSTICEICGSIARNIRLEDFKKVMTSLKEYQSLRERTAIGELTHANAEPNSGVDPDALAAIRRQRLSEVSLWFSTQNNPVIVSHENVDHSDGIPMEDVTVLENSTAEWTLKGSGILLATGLLLVILSWLIAPHVGKKFAMVALFIFLGGVCALTVVVSLRFLSSRFKFGPTRYWTFALVFAFFIFGVWAERTRGVRSSS